MRAERALLIGLTLLYVALYARVVEFAFVWDDVAEIAQNPLLDGPLLEGLSASQHVHMGVHVADDIVPAYDSYRPLRYLSYRLDNWAFGRDPRAFHLHNVVLGFVLACAAYLFLAAAEVGPRLRALAFGLFLLHPLAVEPIAYVSARSDSLASIGILASTSAALLYLRGGALRYAFVSVAAYGASLAAKESLFALPCAALVLVATRRDWLRSVGLCAGWALYFALWWSIRSQFAVSAGASHAGEALRALGPSFVQYLRILVAPFDCSIVRPAAQPDLAITLVALGVFGALALASVIRGSARLRRLLFAASWFVCALGPSVVAARTTGVASDRYGTLTLLVVPALLAAFEELGQQFSRPMRYLLGAVALIYALLLVTVTSQQIAAFRDPVTLYRHAAQLEPSSAQAQYGLGSALAGPSGCAVAEPYFARAAVLAPDHVRALNNLGVCQLRRGAAQDAERSYLAAVAASHGMHPLSHYNLAQLYDALGERVRACAAVRRALRIEPGYERALALAAKVCP